MRSKMMLLLSYFLIGIWLMTGSAFAEPLDKLTTKFVLNGIGNHVVGEVKNKEDETLNLIAQDTPKREGVKVPSVLGMTEAEAKAAIEAAGLVFGGARVGPNRAPKPSDSGRVCGSRYDIIGKELADGYVKPGTPVSIELWEPYGVKVPSVLGMKWREAKALLESLGLVVRLDRRVVGCAPESAGKVTTFTSSVDFPDGFLEKGTPVTLIYCADREEAVKSNIKIVEATYGWNCRNVKPWKGHANTVGRGNVTGHIAAECNGKENCSYYVNYKKIGDPCAGCAKDYEVIYMCVPGGKQKKASLAPEAGWGDKAVRLTCP